MVILCHDCQFPESVNARQWSECALKEVPLGCAKGTNSIILV